MSTFPKNLIVDLSFDFALSIIDYTELLVEKKKFNMANQLFRAGTSIGANVNEAQNCESRADFIHKMKVAAKEAEETKYWLTLCSKSKWYLNPPNEALEQLNVMIKVLTKIIATSKQAKA